MKKTIVLAVCMLLVASAAFAAGTIVNTKHDLSSGATHTGYKSASGNEICVFCHTPHGASSLVPLWNRSVPVGPYTMYTSTTFDGGAATALGGASLACMACHDGTLGIVADINNPSNASPNTVGAAVAGHVVGDKMVGFANLGTALTDDHPVSFSYQTSANADAGLTPFTAANQVFGTSGARLIGTNVECASCHDVHNSANQAPFLRGSNSGSALCLACHIK